MMKEYNLWSENNDDDDNDNDDDAYIL